MTKPLGGKALRTFWNNKARTFPRYDSREGSYEARVMGALEENGVDFTEKTVLDIGCGTGMFTIRIAQKAMKVTGLDISEEMLSILRQDAEKEGVLNKIETVRSGWMEYQAKGFDIVFASMTPALFDGAGKEKMLESGKKFVFMAYDGLHSSDIQIPVYEKYGIKRRHTEEAAKMCEWLSEKGIQHKVIPMEGEWIGYKTERELTDNAVTMLESHGIKPDMAFLADHVKKFSIDGKFKETTKYRINIILGADLDN